MTNIQEVLIELNENLNILKEQEAKYGGAPPLALIHQIKDHQEAIALTEALSDGRIKEADWEESIHPLLVEVHRRSKTDEVCQVKTKKIQQVIIGDIGGNISQSQFAGRDINIYQYNTPSPDTSAPTLPAQRPSKPTKPPGKFPLWQMILVALVAGIGLVVVGGGLLAVRAGLVNLPGGASSPGTPTPMPGTDPKIAISGFTDLDAPTDFTPGVELAQAVADALQQNFDKLEPGFALIWGPDQLEQHNHPAFLTGQTLDVLQDAAEGLAKNTKADLVIYGAVDKESQSVTPRFKVTITEFENITEFKELIGEQGVGRPLPLLSGGNYLETQNAQSQWQTSIEILVHIIRGLTFLSIDEPDYEAGLDSLQQADIPSWQPEQGKYLLYILLGNAAGKVGDSHRHQDDNERARQSYETALGYYQQAFEILTTSDELEFYPNVYLGLGDAYYHLATLPSTEDAGMFLQKAIESFAQAKTYAKVDFTPYLAANAKYGLAESYLIRGNSTQNNQDIDQAFELFNGVIEDYEDYGNNALPLLKERAGEAHARLGLIYFNKGDNNCALKEYKSAQKLIRKSNLNNDEYYKDVLELNKLEADETLCLDN